MTTDRFSTGKTTDGLIHNSLENGCGKVFLSSTVIDQWLDICLGKYTAARIDRDVYKRQELPGVAAANDK